MFVLTRGNLSARVLQCADHLLPVLAAAFLLLSPRTHAQISPKPPVRSAGQNEDAIAPIKAEIVRLHVVRAEVFQKKAHWDRCRTELENAWKLDSESPALELSLAEARLHTGDYHGVIELLEPLARRGPESLNTRKLLGKAYFCAGELEAARRELKGLALPAQPCKSGEKSSSAGPEAEERQKLDESLKSLTEDYIKLAQIQTNLGRFKEAIQGLLVVESLLPPDASLESNLGLVLYRAGQFSEAALHLERAYKANPSDANTNQYLGLTYSELGQYAKAVPFFEQARRSRPNDPGVLLGLANALALSGRSDEAQSAIEDLLRTNPDSAPLHVLWGRAYASQDKPEEARREFRRALEVDPKVPEAHFYLGIMAFQENQMEESGREFQAELAFHPDDARSRYHLAVTLLVRRQIDEGVASLRQVIEARPDYAEAHYALGKTLLGQGKVEEATQELERAVKLDPKAAYSHYQLGRAYLRSGRSEEADQQFRITQTLKDQQLKTAPRPEEPKIP